VLQLAAKDAEITELKAENAELKRRLAPGSTNSGKPPSTDSPFRVPPPRSLRHPPDAGTVPRMVTRATS
jgi:hypothetical protein